MNNKFQGKRAELGVFDDAMGFTQEERDTHAKMLADNSFATGLNIFDDKYWICDNDCVESVVRSSKTKNDILTAKALKGLVETVKKSAQSEDIMFIGYPGMREKIREAGFPIDDYRYVELASNFAPTLDEDQIYILPVNNIHSDIKFLF